ncbi:MAG: hypothetical protein KDA84_30565, partial [Planctomycetaceae bacterium]|nr:hypothetical protein [Planctomycetaceae bacterium]
ETSRRLNLKNCKGFTMAFYISVMGREKIENRLGRLSFEARTLFAMCCVTHGRSTFLFNIDPDDREWYEELVPMIDDFWKSFPDSLDSKWIEQQRVAASEFLDFEDHVEFEDYPFAVGELQIITATIQAFACTQSSEGIKNASSAAYQIYDAIVEVEITAKDGGGAEWQVDRLESQSTTCRSEIEFQLKCLGIIENWQGPLPNYEQVLQAK